MLILICQHVALGVTVLVLKRQLGRSQKLEGDKLENVKAFARDFRQTIMPNVNSAGTKPSTLEFELTFLVLNRSDCFSFAETGKGQVRE